MCHQKIAVGEKGLKKIQNKMAVLVIVGLFIISGVSVVNSNKVTGEKPFFTLVARPMLPHSTMNYYNLITNQLAKIGINVDILVCDCPMTTFPTVTKHGYTDLVVVELDMERFNPTLMRMFSENGSFNSFGYHTSMDWDEQLGTGKNQWYIEQLYSTLPPESEQLHG